MRVRARELRRRRGFRKVRSRDVEDGRGEESDESVLFIHSAVDFCTGGANEFQIRAIENRGNESDRGEAVWERFGKFESFDESFSRGVERKANVQNRSLPREGVD